MAKTFFATLVLLASILVIVTSAPQVNWQCTLKCAAFHAERIQCLQDMSPNCHLITAPAGCNCYWGIEGNGK